jgi:DNA-directed RNA polymerase I, II, and III subunit RPABC1
MDELNEIYRSKKVLCEMLSDRGYITTHIENTTIEEIKIQYDNKVIDFEATHSKKNEKIYVKYFMGNKIKKEIRDIISEWLENPDYNNNDRFIIIYKEKAISNIDKIIEEYKNKFNYIIQIFPLDKLLRNITRHEYQPQFSIVENPTEILQNYSIKTKSKLPWISVHDPVSKYYGLLPGDVLQIKRYSETSGEYTTYRYCH